VDDDSAAYDAVVSAYRLPKATDEEKTRRQAAVAVAMRQATEVPMQTAESCLVVLSAAVLAAAHGNPSAVSDVRTGGALALAGLLGALENVRVNLRESDPDAARLRDKADAAWSDGLRHARELGLPLP
jgi:formiminotetrahydrofolate cyclodeaminase